MTEYVHPEYLIEPHALADLLTDARVRIYDTAVYLEPSGHGYRITSGRSRYEDAHIPGAGFIDLAEHWADPTSALRFTLPPLPALRTAIAESGISQDHRVVLYSSGHMMWATRAWWLLRYAGHRNIAILNGGFGAWVEQGLATEQGGRNYAHANFEADHSVAAFANTAEVEAGMNGQVCTLNALSQALYEGTGDFYYERRGHIPGSRLVYYDTLLDGGRFLPPEALGDALEEGSGALSAERVITYCGGGIAATLNAFACLLCGQENVRVYDGSMSEWVQDPARPLSTGPSP